jgi:hypothetical protein
LTALAIPLRNPVSLIHNPESLLCPQPLIPARVLHCQVAVAITPLPKTRLLFLALLFVVLCDSQQPLIQIVDLQQSPGYYDEPSIAINPHNPAQLVAAFQVNASAAYSTDAGAHWTLAIGTAPTDFRRSGDVSVAYTSTGAALLCYIAFDKLGTPNYWAHNATRNGIYVRRSLDGGRTWEPVARSVFSHPTVPGIPFEDKPYIVADTSGGRYNGNIYVGWTQFTLTQSLILFSRSTDGGATWSKPITISDHAGLPRDDTGAAEGFAGTIGRNGQLHTVWSDGFHIVYAVSSDGGRSFSASRYIAGTAPSNFQVTGVLRSNGYPQISYSSLPGDGRLYVTWSDYRNGDVDIFCISSADDGRTWTAPVRVNNDPVHNGADQFFQWMAVDPQSGAVNVVFYDRRDDPENRKARLFLARSTDHAHTFSNFSVSPSLFDPGEVFLGDYIGVTALANRVYAIWTERRSTRNPISSHSPGTLVRIARIDFK